MFAGTLIPLLALIGTSAMPTHQVPGDLERRDNSTLVRRLPYSPPESFDLMYWTLDNSVITGTVTEELAESPLANCRKVDMKNLFMVGDERYVDVKLACMQRKRQQIIDLRRIGDIKNCDTGTQTETWTVTDSVTTTEEASAGLKATFEAFGLDASVSAKEEQTHSDSYTIEVGCGDFRGKKCQVGGKAVIRLDVIEGWVSVPATALASSPITTWRDQDTTQEPYGMRDFKNDVTHTFGDYGSYASGWNSWEELGEENCRLLLDNKFHNAQLNKAA